MALDNKTSVGNNEKKLLGRRIFVLSIFSLLFWFIFFRPNSYGRVRDSSYQIISVYPHDPQAFTQGLFIDPLQPEFFFEGLP
jgi:glutamine cyclotransferase